MAAPDSGDPSHAGPLLFLSHAGPDTVAARALKRRLKKAAAERRKPLKVWFDKTDLVPGLSWQRQIKEAINQRATAFAVYLGSTGVVNWVEAEVAFALSRATHSGDSFPFVPIISARVPSDAAALPGFARLFHAVRDVENDEGEFEKLLNAALGLNVRRHEGGAGTTKREADPFFGLSAIDEERSHLFFGRERETEELVQRLAKLRLVMVVGDSGSGKSSLVGAGLVTRWRGGALAEFEGRRPNEEVWHVVGLRPGGNPRHALSVAVETAAQQLGVDCAERQSMARVVEEDSIDNVRQALRCGLCPDRTRTLVVVDQFEDLVTSTEEDQRRPFVKLLLDLADTANRAVSVALTMRRDYYNLLSTPEWRLLYHRLEADERKGRYSLGRVSDDGLERIVTEPLRLAGVGPDERRELAETVRRDMGEQPGDLALVQFALTRAWERQGEFGGDLLRSYNGVGGVEGALGGGAERAFEQVFGSEAKAEEAAAALIRLARLEGTAGPTRRVARRREFPDGHWAHLQKLASKEGNRLVIICDPQPGDAAGQSDHKQTAEIAHEALLTRWPRLHAWLNEAPEDKRTLDRLAERAIKWVDAEKEAMEGLLAASDAERGAFDALARAHPLWLSTEEQDFVAASNEAHEAARAREMRLREDAEAQRARAEEQTREANRQREDAEAQRARAEEQTREANRQREQALRQHRRARIGTALAAVLAFTAVDRTVRMYFARAEAEEQRGQAEKQRKIADERAREAEAQRDRALRAQADGLASAADREAGRGDAVTALLLALEPLVEAQRNDRPRSVTAEAERAAYDALLQRREKAVLRGHKGAVLAVAFSPKDGNRLATGSQDGSARLWDVESGREIGRPLRGDEGVVTTEAKIAVLRGHKGLVAAVAFSSLDGGRLATASGDGTARVWDVESRREIRQPLRGREGAVLAVAFSPDGNRLAAGSDDGTTQLWDVEGRREKILHGHDGGRIRAVAFSPNGNRLATGTLDGSVRLWEAAEGGGEWRETAVLRGHEGAVLAVAFSPDGNRLATGSEDGTARLWDVESGREISRPLRGHDDEVLAIAFSPRDGSRLATGSWDGTARLWDVESGREIGRPLRGHEGAVLAVAFSPDGNRLATGSQDGTARLWDAQDRRPADEPLGGHGGPVTAVAFLPRDGNRLAIASWDGMLWLRNPGSGGATGEPLVGHSDIVLAVAFSPDGNRLATGSGDGWAQLWDVRSRNETRKPLGGHGGPVTAVAFSPDGNRLATGSWDGAARLWDVESGREIAQLHGHEGAVLAVAFSPDGNRLATGSQDGTARLWDVRSRNETRKPLGGHGAPVTAVAFSPDGNRLATGSWDGAAWLWDVESGREIDGPLRGHEGAVTTVAFSPDGNRLATGAQDGTAWVWDVEGRRRLAVLRGHGGPVTAVAFSPDGRRLATGSQDHTVRLWDVHLSRKELLDAATERLPRCLSSAQRVAFGLAEVDRRDMRQLRLNTWQPPPPC
jgi:WD40 repeat protein